MSKKTAIAAHVALLGDQIRCVRTDRSLTQTALLQKIKAESLRLRLLGVFDLASTSTYNVVYYMEAGLREPSFSEGILLCQILGIPPESLLPYWIRAKLTYPFAQRAAYPIELQSLQDICLALLEPPSPQQEDLKNALLQLSRDHSRSTSPID